MLMWAVLVNCFRVSQRLMDINMRRMRRMMDEEDEEYDEEEEEK